jgi:hypothetical protein
VNEQELLNALKPWLDATEKFQKTLENLGLKTEVKITINLDVAAQTSEKEEKT